MDDVRIPFFFWGVRYEAYGWHTQVVTDGTDTAAIMEAIEAAKLETGKPSIIKTKTIIGHGSQKQVLFFCRNNETVRAAPHGVRVRRVFFNTLESHLKVTLNSTGS